MYRRLSLIDLFGGGSRSGNPVAVVFDAEELSAELRDQYEEQSRPFYSSARVWDDGVIDTREVLGRA